MNSRSPILHLRSLVHFLLLWLLLSTAAQAQFNYAAINGTITIVRYLGPGGAVVIPDTIDGLPVTILREGAFVGCSSLTSVTIPESVTEIGWSAFEGCHSGVSRGWSFGAAEARSFDEHGMFRWPLYPYPCQWSTIWDAADSWRAFLFLSSSLQYRAYTLIQKGDCHET